MQKKLDVKKDGLCVCCPRCGKVQFRTKETMASVSCARCGCRYTARVEELSVLTICQETEETGMDVTGMA